MYKLDLPVDLRESAAIEARKQRELDRQSRIFNSRVRTIGVDLNALEQQVAEKKWLEEQEKRRSDAFASDLERNDKICTLLDQRRDHDVRNLNKAVNDFRTSHQQPETRREFDLNDPDSKSKDKPARVSDDDPRCGLSSLQRFAGEDLDGTERRKLQQEQLREWTKQQTEEKGQEKAKMERAKHLYDLKAIENDLRASELAKAEQECRRALNVAMKDYNRALAMEKNVAKELQDQQELDDNMTEIGNHIYGDMLTENPSVAQSAFGSHRVITDRWKGMSPAEKNSIKQTQHEQLLEKQQLEAEQNRLDAEWDKQRLSHAKSAIIMERNEMKKRKELLKQQALENLRLSAEKKRQQEYLDKEVYTNSPTAAYFTQFNTTSR